MLELGLVVVLDDLVVDLLLDEDAALVAAALLLLLPKVCTLLVLFVVLVLLAVDLLEPTYDDLVVAFAAIGATLDVVTIDGPTGHPYPPPNPPNLPKEFLIPNGLPKELP